MSSWDRRWLRSWPSGTWPEFTGVNVTFDWAQFTQSALVTFDGPKSTGRRVTRDGAEFRGWPPARPRP